MENIREEFIQLMLSTGLAPYNLNDIKPDNKRRNYRCNDDSSSKKSCFYKLAVDGDFGYGYFGSYKTDEYYSFCSKSSKKYSKSEIEAYRTRLEKEREQELKTREEIYIEKSKECRDFLFFLEHVETHPYLKRKGLPSGYGALHSGENLIVPMHDFEQIWNYQRIKPDGEKLYFQGAKKAGTWFAIEGDTDVIYIAEGYATAVSVHMATGMTTLAAFDTSNLEYVVKAVLSKYPKANIVLAADNDHETIVNQKFYNAGVEKARKIAAKYPEIKIRFPVFKDPEGKSDFNDLYQEQGLNAVAKQLQEQAEESAALVDVRGGGTPPHVDTPAAVPDEPPINQDWRERLIANKNGLVPNSTINATLVLENDEKLRGVFKYDGFAKQILVMRCPPWMSERDFKVRPIQDHDYIPLECYLESEWRLRCPKAKCADIISSVAMKPENTFNPAREYFDGLEWDGTPRLDTWLRDYVSDGGQNENYLSLVGRKFLCGLAARAMYPGIKFDTMIIFEGEQYAGKSFLSRIMGTIHGEEYFLDDFKDIENKDALMKMQGKLVVEFPEISTLRKAEVNDLKAFITRQTDEFRPPYGRNVMTAPRQCVFVGTVNPEGAYFKDMTGNRRYWPVTCRKRLALAELKLVMPKLHAEAAHMVKNGEQLWLSEKEYEQAQIEQNKRVMSDLWIDKIENIIEIRETITSDEILQELGIKIESRNNMVFTRLQQVMAQLGWHPARVTEGSKRKRGFRKNDVLQAVPQNMDEEEIIW